MASPANWAPCTLAPGNAANRSPGWTCCARSVAPVTSVSWSPASGCASARATNVASRTGSVLAGRGGAFTALPSSFAGTRERLPLLVFGAGGGAGGRRFLIVLVRGLARLTSMPQERESARRGAGRQGWGQLGWVGRVRVGWVAGVRNHRGRGLVCCLFLLFSCSVHQQ